MLWLGPPKHSFSHHNLAWTVLVFVDPNRNQHAQWAGAGSKVEEAVWKTVSPLKTFPLGCVFA